MQQNHNKDEIIDVGNELLIALENALSTMDGANNWGLLDLLSGNYYMTYIKHYKIESAEENLAHVKYLSQQFECELNEFERLVPQFIDATPFILVSRYFFENLYFDLLVQGNIAAGKEALKEMIRCIEKILRTLNHHS